MITVTTDCDGVEPPDLDDSWIHNISTSILKDNGHDTGTISVIYSSDNSLRKLKKIYFQQDVFTDVISFNLENKGEPLDGEIYISLDRVKDNAAQYHQDYLQELKRVVIHGCLHLLGFDDQTPFDKEKMTRLEENYLSKEVLENLKNG